SERHAAAGQPWRFPPTQDPIREVADALDIGTGGLAAGGTPLAGQRLGCGLSKCVPALSERQERHVPVHLERTRAVGRVHPPAQPPPSAVFCEVVIPAGGHALIWHGPIVEFRTRPRL